MPTRTAPQAPIIVLKVASKTNDELTLRDSRRAGLFLGIVIVAFCGLVATVVLVFGMFVPVDQLAIYYQAFFGPLLVFSGIIFIVGAYLLLSFSEKRIAVTKSSGRISVMKKTLWGTRTLATYEIKDALRIEWRSGNTMEKINDGNAAWAKGAAVGIFIRQALLKPQEVLVNQAVMVFQDRSELLLASAKTLSTGRVFGDLDSSIRVINQVASFLGIPVEEKKA